MRWSTLATTLVLASFTILPTQAESLRDMRLQETLNVVAKESSAGTPRRLNDDIVDEGFRAQDGQLINTVSFQAEDNLWLY